MLSIERIYTLSWLYLLFRMLDQNIRYNALTREHLQRLVQQRLHEYHFIMPDKLRLFGADLALAAHATPHPFRSNAYTLSSEDRALIAYHFNLVSLQEETWWKHGVDKMAVYEFAVVVNITREESHEFFEHLVLKLHGINDVPTLKAVS